MPKPLVRGDQALHVAPPRAIRRQRTAGQHHLKDVQQLLGHLEIGLVAGVVEGDQHLVRQAPRVSRCPARTNLPPTDLVGLVCCIAYRGVHVASSRLIQTRVLNLSGSVYLT